MFKRKQTFENCPFNEQSDLTAITRCDHVCGLRKLKSPLEAKPSTRFFFSHRAPRSSFNAVELIEAIENCNSVPRERFSFDICAAL